MDIAKQIYEVLQFSLRLAPEEYVVDIRDKINSEFVYLCHVVF